MHGEKFGTYYIDEPHYAGTKSARSYRMKRLNAVAIVCVLVGSNAQLHAEETLNKSVELPGMYLEQSVTYSTSKSDYETRVKDTVERVETGDFSAALSPEDDPRKSVTTKAGVGIGFKGTGAYEGRTTHHESTASEEAYEILNTE